MQRDSFSQIITPQSPNKDQEGQISTPYEPGQELLTSTKEALPQDSVRAP